MHGQPDCPGGHLPGPGRAGLDQPHVRRRPGSPASGPREASPSAARAPCRWSRGIRTSTARRWLSPARRNRPSRRSAQKTIQASFGADTAAFDRLTPLSVMAEDRFDGHGVYFAAGDRDPEFTRPHGRAFHGGTKGRVHCRNAPDRQRGPLVGDRGQRPARRPGLPGPPLGRSRHERGHQQRRTAAGQGPEGASLAGRLAARACGGRWHTSGPCPSPWRSSRPSS